MDRFTIEEVDSVDSTNEAIKQRMRWGRAVSGWVMRAEHQTSGRGQFGTTWESQAGSNLLFSLLLIESNLPAERPFQLNMTICRTLVDALRDFVPQVRIKWPNDLYVGDRKLGGILIENQWLGGRWQSAIAGIGINVMQTEFASAQAIGLRALNPEAPSPSVLMRYLLARFDRHWGEWGSRSWEAEKADYLVRLLGYRELQWYRWVRETDSPVFQAAIEEVSEEGTLHLRRSDGVPLVARFKEIARLSPEEVHSPRPSLEP